MPRTPSRRAMLKLGFPLWLAACSADAGSATPGEQTIAPEIELRSWWIAPSELDALQALFAVHKSNYPNDIIRNVAYATGDLAKEMLEGQLASNKPPDLYQENAYDLRPLVSRHPNSFASLTDLFTQQGLFDVVVPEVILKLEVPTSLDELFSVCEQLNALALRH